MRIGAARKQVEWLAPFDADDGAGGFVQSYTVQGRCWAEVRSATPAEMDRAGRRDILISHVVTVRRSPSLPVALGWVARWTDSQQRLRTVAVQAADDADDDGRFLRVQTIERAAVLPLSAPGANGITPPMGSSPPPPPPAPIDPRVFSFASPLSVWVINHNLGFKPSVELWDLAGREVEGDVTHSSDNQLQVSWITPQAGTARLT